MRHRGITIVELLGAIVLFGIIASISAMMISTITKANAKIVEQSRANTEITLLTAYLDDQYQNLGATNYTPCVGESNCIILIKAFEYVPNLVSGTIDLVVYDPVVTLTIKIQNQELLLDDTTYDINYFQIDNSSSLSYTLDGTNLILEIDLTLIGEHDTYQFHYQKTLVIESVPIG